MQEDQLLARITELCLFYPETTCERSGSHATFKVRKRVFAYFLDNHYGDGKVAVCCKTALGEHTDLAKEDPVRFYIPAYIGPRGWIAIRLDRGRVNWKEVADFVRASYRAVAPAKLVKDLTDGADAGGERYGSPSS
jgi:predicted DNA-binding protein (MmcQ/YjbR family)